MMKKISFSFGIVVLGFSLIGLLFASCIKKGDQAKSFWIYTSLYKDIIADLEPSLKRQFPDVQFEWYQSGSENVAARLNAELAAGSTQADLLLTSDAFWYLELKNQGHLLSYLSPKNARVANDFRDGDGFFATVRMPVVVLAYNSESIPKEKAPTAWSQLTDPKWKGKISMGSPVESGTAFNAVAQLTRKKGWSFFEELRKNEILAAGGNSAVVNRLETKERPIGILLLENVLEAQKRGSPVTPVYPTDGAVLVPSPMAIMAKTKNQDLAKKIYDFFLDDEMQQGFVRGRMYSPVMALPSPSGAREFKLVLANTLDWNNKVLEELYLKRDETKKRFVQTVLN